MKKPLINHGYALPCSRPREKGNPLFRILASAFLIASVCVTTVSAQTAKVNISGRDMSLQTVLAEIEKQTSYLFVYNNNEIALDSKTSFDGNEATVRDILTKALQNTGIGFQLEGNNIMLMKQQPVEKSRSVSGTVVDENGAPLQGTTVVVRGTQIGAVTDAEGNFTVNGVQTGSMLVVNYTGYKTREVTVGVAASYNIAMQPSDQFLDVVVATALGIKRAEKALSYNVQTINSDEVTTVKSTNFINALAGKVAGVTINAGSSGMGGASKVVMRGAKSIAQSNNALYVIDGIPMYNTLGEGDSGAFSSSGTTEAIADINPEDIENISVLTGAAAAALYGNQGANGAILITTKQGTADKLEVIFSSSSEFYSPFVLPAFQNRYGTGDISAASGSTIKSWGRKLVPENSYGYDPRKDFFETGTSFTNSLSVSTGTEKNQTYFSAAVVNSDGIVPNTQYDRYNFTFRNTSSFLKDKMKLDVGAGYIMQKDQNMRNQGIYSNPVASAYLFPRGDDFDMVRVFERFDPQRLINVQYWPQGEGDHRLQNPYWIAYRNLNNNDRKRYMLHTNLSYDILDWLNISGRVRVDNSKNDYTQKAYATTNSVFSGPNGQYLIARSHDWNTYGDILVSVNKYFGELSLNVVAGASINDFGTDVLNVNGPIRDDGIPNVFNIIHLDRDRKSAVQDGWRQQSQAVFASAEVGYKNAYYLTLTARNDWESALSNTTTKKRGFFYPSAGVSVVLSEIWRMPEQIRFLKLRASFAKVGTPIPRSISQPTYPWDANTGKWSPTTLYPIPKFKPESTNSWEFGLTANFLHHFRLDFSWYRTNTYNQTFEPQLSVSSGYSTIYMQTGNVRNAGVEASLNYSNRWSDFGWSSTAIFSLNRNKIMELVKDQPHPETGEIINKDRLNIGGLGRVAFILKTGGSLGDVYTTSDLVRDSSGKIYVDENGYPQPDFNADDIYLGSVFPKSNVSWRNDLSWKNLNLNFMLTARFGGVVYSGTQAALDFYGVSENTAVARDRGYVLVNGEERIDPQAWYTTIGASNGIASHYTYSATNIRLQELSIGYTIPRSKLGGVVNITVSLVGRNLWMIYNKAPFDPESVASTGNYYQGMDNFIMPSLRSMGFNLKIKF